MAQEEALSAQRPLRLAGSEARPRIDRGVDRGIGKGPGGTGAARLLLASNREPFTTNEDEDATGAVRPSMGGLATGLMPLLERRAGIWVCWDPDPRLAADGDADGDADADTHRTATGDLSDEGPFPLLQVGLQPSEVRDYYNGFCNRVLWPLCHAILKRVSPRLDYWQQFRSVNEKFADVIAGIADADDVIWLHDYHLMLVPEAIRRRIGHAHRIGYFHHVPFPEPELIRALPWHRQLLCGLLGADSVGFHTADYAVSFIESCGELLECDVDSEPGTIIHRGRRTVVRARPIGIDVGSFVHTAEEPAVARRAAGIRGRFACDCLMLSVDRLDYTKGLVERIEAIFELFSRLPQCRGIVTFLQVAVPTRKAIPDYQQYRARFEAMVRTVNARFGTDEWQPIVCITDAMSREELVAHYMAADVACVTPVADGMNLVALEYCASRTANDGVLVLSRQAGASTLLGESAVSVDARSTESLVGGLVQALTMPASERTRRMSELRSVVLRSTSEKWTRRCLTDIQVPSPAPALRAQSVN